MSNPLVFDSLSKGLRVSIHPFCSDILGFLARNQYYSIWAENLLPRKSLHFPYIKLLETVICLFNNVLLVTLYVPTLGGGEFIIDMSL